MKKMVCTAVSAIALAAFADGVNSTEFGVLPVPSTAEETIISVPWLESGTGSDEVKVCDLVLTAGLNAAVPPATNGDTLKYYDGSNWQAWLLTEDATTHVKSWQPSSGGATADKTVVRGRALLLKRPSTRQSKFYVMGKPATGTATVTLGTGYTLVAPTNVSSTPVEANSATWTGIVLGDQLLIPKDEGGYKQLSWDKTNNRWRMWNGKDKVWETTGLTIDAGKGAWFVNKEGGSGKSVAW